MKASDRVFRIQDSEPRGATVRLVQGLSALIEYEEGGEGWWPIECLELDDPADWSRFRALTFGSSGFLLVLGQACQHENPEVRALAAILPTTYLLAEQGSIEPFRETWRAFAGSAGIPLELAEQATQAAVACQLPENFIEALNVA